jgi:ABC-type uncharacterized transport system ATPase subunit
LIEARPNAVNNGHAGFSLDDALARSDPAARIPTVSLRLHRDTMNYMVRKGAAIILNSSDGTEISGFSNQISGLARGRIAAQRERGAATKARTLAFATK